MTSTLNTGHDAYTCKKIQVKISWCQRQNENKRTDTTDRITAVSNKGNVRKLSK